ncbi:MAG: hypothetical protein AAGN82_09875 [Myxococcota bacterium]
MRRFATLARARQTSPRRPGRSLLALTVPLLLASGCADSGPDVGTQEAESTSFQRDLVLLDEAMVDAEAFDEAAIQAFLEATPYGSRSVLADHLDEGVTAAAAIAEAAQTHGINPLAILTRAQMEQSLIARTSASQFRIDRALGCGCPDGLGCSSTYRGFRAQTDCMGTLMRSYLDDQDAQGKTVTGWGVGRPKRTLDGITVVPRSRATAALYTYTPWVSSNRAHERIWSRFAEHVGYVPPAPGGCPVLSYPSGVDLQTRPEDDGVTPPRCLLHPAMLYDPVANVTHAPSTKLSPNFRLSEFQAASATTWFSVVPELVATLQATRVDLGRSISIDIGFQTADGRADLCAAEGSFCDAGGLETGEGVVVRSGASREDVLAGAAAAGATSCFPVDADTVYIGVESPGVGCSP